MAVHTRIVEKLAPRFVRTLAQEEVVRRIGGALVVVVCQSALPTLAIDGLFFRFDGLLCLCHIRNCFDFIQ